MSAAIATASRDDKPSSTIGMDSSIESGDCPVALPTQLRIHCRISGTVMFVRAGAFDCGVPSALGEVSAELVSISVILVRDHLDSPAKAVGDATPRRRLPLR